MAVFALNPRVWVVLGTVFAVVLLVRVVRGWVAELRRRWAPIRSGPQSLNEP